MTPLHPVPINFEGIRRASHEVYRHLEPTPLLAHPLLSQELDCKALVKHEDVLPTGAFKIRGGMHLLASLAQEQRRRGLVTATRGNHGQSIALACATHGARCTIFVPRGNNPEKNAAMRAYGATVIETGRDFDEARGEAEELVRKEGMLYIPITEPRLILGVGSLALEVFDKVAAPDFVLVSVGLGTLASSMVVVARELSPRTQVIAVQAAGAPAVHDAWQSGEIKMAAGADTIADGLASRIASANTLKILREGLADFVLVSEEELAGGIRLALATTHHLAEGASAACYAAAVKLRERLAGKTVVIVHSGCNIATAQLRQVLAGGDGNGR